MRSGTVREVAEAIAPRHSLAYTTVMTLLERLVKRGQLTREKAGRSFVYTPAQDPARLREIAVTELAQDYFGGSREALRDWLEHGPAAAAAPVASASETIDTALL